MPGWRKFRGDGAGTIAASPPVRQRTTYGWGSQHERQRPLGSFDQTRNPDQNHCADEGDDDRADDAATGPDSKLSEEPPSQDAAENSKDDVDENAVSSTLHDLAREPSCDQSN